MAKRGLKTKKRTTSRASSASAFGPGRERFANIAGYTFGGKRDLYKTLGYKRELDCNDYRARFDRNEVANRIVKAAPDDTWRGGAEVVEDENPTNVTEFEKAFDLLNQRLNIWPLMRRADVLSGIGRYAIIVMGAPGKTEEPLDSCKPEDLQYLQPYAEYDAKVQTFDVEPLSPRYGLPITYSIRRTPSKVDGASNTNSVAATVHFTRVLHVADGLLDDGVYGEPRLRLVWNRLDDLEKVAGGGAEAFWRRADGGMQFELDPEVSLDEEQDATGNTATATKSIASKSGLRKQIEDYEHGLRRFLLTRGVKINRLGSDVADIAGPVNAIISLISAGTGIPQRVLMGSEQGKLAASADRTNWGDRIVNRRDQYAAPLMVRNIVDRFIQLGVLPQPADGYNVQWPSLRVMDDKERAQIATQWASLNKNANEVVVTADEIRDRILNLPSLSDVMDTTKPVLPMTMRKLAVLSYEKRKFYIKALKAAAKRSAKEGSTAPDSIQRTADRFREAFKRAVLTAFGDGRTRLASSETPLKAALAAKSAEGVLALVNPAIEAVSRTMTDRVPKVTTQILKASGQDAAARIVAMAKRLRAAAPAKGKADVGLGFKFDVTNPAAKQWIEDHAADLVADVDDTTRQRIKELLDHAFDGEFDVDELANQVSDVIGNDARAETIARTETMTASNRGQQEAWDQAVDAGLLTGNEKQVWIVTPDERLCPICAPLDGVTADLDGTFRADGDDIDGPPAHPNCRCTIGLSE